MYLNKIQYNGAIMNISISGALVLLNGSTPGALKPGDSCSFILRNDPDTYFYRYKGRVARVNTSEVGLEIIGHEF
jgi:hypothetical protein